MNHWMHLAASSWSNRNLKSKQFWWRLYFYFILLIKLFFNAWQFHSHIQWNKSISTLSPSSYSPAYPPPCLPTNFMSFFFFLEIYFIFNFANVYVFVLVYAPKCQCSQVPGKSDTPKSGVTGDSEPPNLGAKSWAQVLHMSSKCF